MSNIGTRLLEIMSRLRDPQGGCPWDLEQTFASIAPYTVEEAYEVADAISRDKPGLRDELGDLLLQVVFHAQMADEAGLFGFDEVAEHCRQDAPSGIRTCSAARRRSPRAARTGAGKRSRPTNVPAATIPAPSPAWRLHCRR